MKGFQKGNKHGRGGKRAGAGAKKQSEIEVRKQAAEIAREYIEAKVSPVLETYGQLAGGRWVNHYNAQTGALIYKDFEADAPTTRHFIDKVLPEIKPDESRSGNTYIYFDFGNTEAAGPTPEAGFSEEGRRSFDGGALYIGGDGGES